MHKKLREIADVHAGYTFRKPEKGTATSPYPVIRIKDVANDGTLDVTNLATQHATPVPERFLLRPGDVLFCSRGKRNRAAVFGGDVENAVAGTQFFVIEVKADRVLPAYLAWWINQVPTQKYLASRTHGSYIDMIPREVLVDLAVPVPPLEIQKQILAVHELALREQELMEKLRGKRAEVVSAICGEVAEKFSTRSKQ